MLAVSRLRSREAIESARPESNLAAIEQRADLEQDAIAILQRADDRPRIAAGEEMSVQCGERPLQVAAEKRLCRLEEIALGDVRRELSDVGFFDLWRFALDRAVACVGRQLARFLHDQARVCA